MPWLRPFAPVSAFTVLLVATASGAAPIVEPSDLGPGDSYRLVFVTSAPEFANDTAIATYDAIVQFYADTVPELAALGAVWKMIGSTETIDARDHTDTNPSSAGVPVYNLADIRVADGNADLWDGTVDAAIRFDETGAPAESGGGAVGVWTGTTSSGTASAANELGTSGTIATGLSDQTGVGWIDAFDAPAESGYHLYGISETLTIVPEPATGALVLVGLAALGGARRR